MTALFQQQQVTSKFSLSAIILSESMLGALRREIRRLFDIRIEEDALRLVLETDVLKREMIESDEAKQAADRKKNSKGRGESEGQKLGRSQNSSFWRQPILRLLKRLNICRQLASPSC